MKKSDVIVTVHDIDQFTQDNSQLDEQLLKVQLFLLNHKEYLLHVINYLQFDLIFAQILLYAKEEAAIAKEYKQLSSEMKKSDVIVTVHDIDQYTQSQLRHFFSFQMTVVYIL
jgi:hypothetical protein